MPWLRANVLALLFTLDLVLSQISDTNCTLDIRLSSTNISTCASGNSAHLIENCCTIASDEYLYALGKRANLTRNIFLNPTEKNGCLTSMKRAGNDVMGCGIEKLTSGAGGCSDYTVMDVANNLGIRLRNLGQSCRNSDIPGGLDQVCNACKKRWGEINGASNEEISRSEGVVDVCRFSVLVSMISSRIDDEKWVFSVFKCLREQGLEEHGSRAGGRRKMSTGLWILIGVLLGITALAGISAYIIIFRTRNRKSPKTWKYASDDWLSCEGFVCRKVSLKEVYSSTNNLNSSNFIGQGVAGKVYRGILSNGQHVAIKHITKDGEMETFVREVRSLSHIRNPNLVALLGYCEKEDECFLVYELCHHGNLSEWLYGKDRVLSWIQRLNIAIGSARGLWFLHSYPQGQIVHRDIKPTNILITADFQAKLSDFGLSKVMDIGQSHVSSEVRGTFGYVDPEYQKNHHVNASGDVYSFGIVLLQLISGQRVINMNSSRPMPLNQMAKIITTGSNTAEFADPKLNGGYPVEAFELVLKLALSCTGLKQERPSMEKVASTLEIALRMSMQMS